MRNVLLSTSPSSAIYSLSAEHKEGKHKARVFAAALELEADDAEWLRDKLSEIATNEDCQLGRKTDYGQRYLD